MYTSLKEFSNIVRVMMNEKIVEMKPVFLQLISCEQFTSMDHEDPHTHLYTFYELCDIVDMIDKWGNIIIKIVFIFFTS